VALSQAARAEREAAAARRELVRAERISGFLASLYREQDPLARGAARSSTPQASLAEAVARVGRELGDEPAIAARLLRVLGEAQLNLGELLPARATLERARALADGAGNPLLGAEIDAVSATVALRELRQDDAERLFAQALGVAVAQRGADSLEAARIDAQRALSLVQLGRFKDARAAAEHADRVLSTRLPAADAERISARVTLGMILEQLREDAGAQDALRSAIAAIESAYGADDARLVTPLQSLGEVLRRARAFDEGRAALQRGAAIARAQFGAVHATASSILVRLATLERDAGDARRAIAVLDEAVAALPPDEVGARAQLLATRGGTWIELGDGLRAEADLREAVRLRRESGGLRNGLAWYNQAQLGEALMLQGRLDEADATQAEAARELRALLGPDAYQNALVAQRWAKTLEARGDFDAAAAQWRESLRLVEATYGVDHFGHLDMGSRLAAALARTPGGHDEALALADTLLARWQARPDTGDRIAALRGVRCGLAGSAADAAAARELLAADAPRVDPALRAALRRCMGA
jgi:serine/threonine-protein kinase